MSSKLIKSPLAALLIGCLGTAFSAQADIVIGVAGPFSGPNATYGDQYWRGASQAAADINAAGGIKGEKIKLVQGDDACEPKQAVAVANRLVDQDKVSAVVGHFCSSSTMPASEVYDEAGIIAITPGSTNPQITERGMKTMFRMCGRAKDGGVPIHEFLGIDYNPNLKFIFIYAVLFLVVLLVLFIKHRLTRMPIGRAWEALREDEIACRSLGLNHVLVKLSAFMLGASTAGLAGVFFATYQGFVNPTSFTFFESALILAIVVLGGMGSTLGVVLAAFVLTVAPELLRSFAEYRVLLFGVLMVAMMIWRPRGLVRISRASFAERKGVAP
ncbi:ABC transporter permease subunit [Serratia marcescens]|uniref:ABC transporter permease subunit n=1 Tax=Serratia marcescens TaxID=615 RepID=UPI001866EB32|nr:ABC transporter substrate-binding protein [Serratia marcescens]